MRFSNGASLDIDKEGGLSWMRIMNVNSQVSASFVAPRRSSLSHFKTVWFATFVYCSKIIADIAKLLRIKLDRATPRSGEEVY